LLYIGKLDKNKLGEYKNKLVTEDVVITDERINHIKTQHPNIFEKYIQSLSDFIEKPNYILRDKKNVDTLLILKRIDSFNENIQIVIKLQIKNEENKANTILTFWKIRDRNYNSTIKNNEIIYKI